MPENVKDHFGIELKLYILQLNYELNVPHKRIIEHLNNIGIQISAGQLNNILIENHDKLHEEKEKLLEIGKNIFPYLSVDDTGARHKGKNGFCTHIGNEYFSYFKSTNSKSRINYLLILRGQNTDYVFTEESFGYMFEQGLCPQMINRLKGKMNKIIANDVEWNKFIKIVGIKFEKHIKIITEAALIGSIISHGINKDLVIVSDDAGQFDIFQHALCWLHAERKLSTIIPINDLQSQILENIRSEVWEFYINLKLYKMFPSNKYKLLLDRRFDEIFFQKCDFEVINNALRLIYEDKRKLLLVLDRPDIPIHNNISENSIRAFVTKRKVHGGTRSENGRLCRDTFISLKKTCLKLGVSFRDLIFDRLSGSQNIPFLFDLMVEKFAISQL